jgi:hypothetical protein
VGQILGAQHLFDLIAMLSEGYQTPIAIQRLTARQDL